MSYTSLQRVDGQQEYYDEVASSVKSRWAHGSSRIAYKYLSAHKWWCEQKY